MGLGKLKKQICGNYARNAFCPMGDKCKFAHGGDELRLSASSSDGQKTNSAEVGVAKGEELIGGASSSNSVPAEEKPKLRPRLPKPKPAPKAQPPAEPQPDSTDSHFKAKLCNAFTRDGLCSRGDSCRYAHGKAEIRTYTDDGESYSALDKFVLEHNLEDYAETALREQRLDLQALVIAKPLSGADKSRILLGRIRQLQQQDWICPDCGNVNYTLRMFCHLRRCGRQRTGLEIQVSRAEREVHVKDAAQKPVSNPALEAALREILAGVDDWNSAEEKHATFAELVRNMKRVSRPAVEAWNAFINCEGSNILDPYRHESEALLRFIELEGPTWLSEHSKDATNRDAHGSSDNATEVSAEAADVDSDAAWARAVAEATADWTCAACGAINEGSQDKCILRRCGAPRPS